MKKENDGRPFRAHRAGGREAPPEEVLRDGELVRYLDGELDETARAAVEARLADGGESAGRLAVLARRSRALSALLADLDPPGAAGRARGAAAGPRARTPRGAARRRSGRPIRLAAAASAIVLGLALGVPQARAWVVDRTRELAGALGLAAPRETLAGATDPADASPSAAGPGGPDWAFDFPVRGDTFRVEVPEPGGRLVLRAGPGEGGSASVTNAGGSSLVVLAGRIRIEGTPAAGTVYELTLPSTVTIVVLGRGGGPPESHALPRAGAELSILLAGGARDE